MFKTDINIDPFTGLPNFFELLESTPLVTYGTAGSIIAFDIYRLTSVNENYGKNAGNYCLKILAELLRLEITKNKITPPATAYRIGGDDFLLILPQKSKTEANHLAIELKRHFKESILKRGFLGVSLNTSIINYGKKGISASQLIKAVYLGLSETGELHSKSNYLPNWADQLIDGMADRVCETLNLLRQARYLALTDEVTGLPNYRAANLFLHEMLGFHQLSKEPWSILFIDGDNLRQYNNLGYQRGNQMIHELANIIAGSLRQDDRIARWLSGDEFLVFLPNTNREMAFYIGERLRSAVEQNTREWPFPVTISIGVACCPENGTVAQELLTIAETANSNAKKAGKNQVS